MNMNDSKFCTSCGQAGGKGALAVTAQAAPKMEVPA